MTCDMELRWKMLYFVEVDVILHCDFYYHVYWFLLRVSAPVRTSVSTHLFSHIFNKKKKKKLELMRGGVIFQLFIYSFFGLSMAKTSRNGIFFYPTINTFFFYWTLPLVNCHKTSSSWTLKPAYTGRLHQSSF